MITVPPAIMQPIDAAFAAINTHHLDSLDTLFAGNATVIDEVPPFEWTGPRAASRWFNDVDTLVRREAHDTTVTAKFERVTEYRTNPEGDDAYVTVSMNVRPAHSKAKPEEGLWVLTLHKTAGSWKITSASWATIPDQK